jgi:hypothetical protein
MAAAADRTTAGGTCTNSVQRPMVRVISRTSSSKVKVSGPTASITSSESPSADRTQISATSSTDTGLSRYVPKPGIPKTGSLRRI